MSWVTVGLTIGAKVGGALMGGRQADKNKKLVEEAEAAAEAIYKDKLRAGKQKLALEGEATELAYTTGMDDLSIGTQAQIIDVKDFESSAIQKSNLVTPAIQKKADEAAKSAWAMYSRAEENLVKTRELEEKKSVFTYDRLSADAQNILDQEKASLADVPTTYMQGVGQSLFG